MKLADLSIRRPVFASMMILALVVVGVAGYFKLGVDRFPAVDFPTVFVQTQLPGASPWEMETLVSQRIEEAVNRIEGVNELRSISAAGRSFIILTFNLNRDIDTATQDVRDRVATVMRDLPREIDPPTISKMDMDRAPILTVALHGNRSLRELTEYADKVVKVQLERSEGVGEVELVGASQRAINVWIDANRLSALSLPITSVRDAIARQNSNIPGGNVTADLQEKPIRTVGRVVDPKTFNEMVVATIKGSPIRIKDIGYAEDGLAEERSVARMNGKPTVSLEIRRQSGANTIAVIEGLKSKLDRISAQLPADVKLEVIRDQSRYIYEALHEINVHLVLGSIFASMVVLIFMRSWRSTLIAAVAIPTSVISTFGMMWALGFTLNSVTMLALVLMVGIVIDDAIVVLENIFRFVVEKKMGAMQAAKEATEEIGLAVLATTLSLVVIFVPVSFMSSISGRFLFQFGITAAVAIMVSLLVSFTLTPMMCAKLLRKEDVDAAAHHDRKHHSFYMALENKYLSVLAWSMRHRGLMALISLLTIASSVPFYKMVKQEFTPANVDEGEFDLNVTAPEGTSLRAMDEVSRQIEADLATIPAIKFALCFIGGGGPGSGLNQARFYIRIPPHDERTFGWKRLISLNPLKAFQGNYTQRDVIAQVRKKLKKYSDLRISVRGGSSSIQIGGGNFELDFSMLGPELEKLHEYMEKLRIRAPEIGIIDADTTLKLDKPELKVEIDRARAAALGVDSSDIATAIRIMVGGDQRVSRFRDPSVNEDYDVQLRLSEEYRNDPNVISRLYVANKDGALFRLDNLVQIVPGNTASRIDRLDRQRLISLRGSIAPGYALADRLQALNAEVAKLNLPPAYTTKISGRGRELEKTFHEFLWAFLLSVIFMYMILASQYESLVDPFTILLSLPLSLPFALFSLWVTNNTLNLYSALGLLVLFGVVKKNAILQIDHMNNLRRHGMDRLAAILQANRDRLRPILMTTLALVAGMLPLALGTGPGSEERRAVAVVVVGGQSLCLLLTLVVTPVTYSLLEDLGLKLRLNRASSSKRVFTLHSKPQPQK